MTEQLSYRQNILEYPICLYVIHLYKEKRSKLIGWRQNTRPSWRLKKYKHCNIQRFFLGFDLMRIFLYSFHHFHSIITYFSFYFNWNNFLFYYIYGCPMIVSILDCQGKICKNGAIMEEGSCNCTCPNRTQIYGPSCDGNYYALSEFFHKSNFSFFK